MQQINFRLDEGEKAILSDIAKSQGLSVAEYVRQAVLKEIRHARVENAFNLLKEGLIGKKRAFSLSGMTYNEFLLEMNRRDIHEQTSFDAFKTGILIAKSLDPEKFKKFQ